MNDTITIIGQGKMGKTLAGYFEKKKIPTQIIGRETTQIEGQIVILALPYTILSEMVLVYQDQLADKIIIDISNPMDYQTKQSLLPSEQSVTMNLAEAFPQLTFLKAFNTNFTSSRVSPTSQPLVLMAGNQVSAKQFVTETLQKASFSVLDMGEIENSCDLEALARIQVQLLEAGATQLLEKFAL
ncbi:NADPH-dependent F420 reductase [Streptococcus cameli]